MRLKGRSVSLMGLCPQIGFAIQVVNDVYGKYASWKPFEFPPSSNLASIDDSELVITSGNDSSHSNTSLHWDGRAIDFRTKNTRNPEVLQNEISRRLSMDFDVILEDLKGPNEHIHIEWQPRRR